MVDNDPTLDRYAAVAVAQAQAGAHVIAPSGMMDGQVAAIRRALDGAAFTETPILAYAAKYASGFYGPFREAAEGAPQFGDRSTYQMDPPNADEALREVAQDLAEGADAVMVKPALPYLDIVARVADAVHVPVAAYQVSGEYAMVEAAAANGWVDRQRAVLETLTAIRRAGAGTVLTYWAVEAARWLRGDAPRTSSPAAPGGRSGWSRPRSPSSSCSTWCSRARTSRRCSGWWRSSSCSASSPPARCRPGASGRSGSTRDAARRRPGAGAAAPTSTPITCARSTPASTPARRCSAAGGRCPGGAPGCR